VSERDGEQGWREVEVEGFRILVGRSAAANDDLTLRVARPNDLWLHAAGCSGSHVVVAVPRGVDVVPARVVERAAELAAFYSKAKDAGGKVPVHLCRASDVRKERGAPAGEVRLRRYRAVKAYPRGI
jgi:predicted ribosome quality control (RQC) complex YloA/Tae2 family protein